MEVRAFADPPRPTGGRPKRPVHLRLADGAIAEYLRSERLLAFGDLHTHPGRAFLSDADRNRPFSQRDGFLAVVIPDFAAGAPGVGWRFYEVRSGIWDEIAPQESIDGWPL